MAGLLDIHTRRAEALAQGLKDLADGSAASVVFEGSTYTIANRDSLDLLYELYLLRSAREAILAGAQQHTIHGRTFLKANLAEVNADLRRVEQLCSRAGLLGSTARTGPRVRNVVPL